MLKRTWHPVGLGLALALSGSGAGAHADPPQGRLVVQVDGLRSDAGQIALLVFCGEDGFPGKHAKACRRDATAIPKGATTVTLQVDRLPYGSYALFVYHDQNGNGQLDKNWIGMPNDHSHPSIRRNGRLPPVPSCLILVGVCTPDDS